MTTAKAIEYQITQQLLRRRDGISGVAQGRFVERAIRMSAMSVGLVLLGSCLQELLWAVLAGSIVITLGFKNQ